MFNSYNPDFDIRVLVELINLIQTNNPTASVGYAHRTIIREENRPTPSKQSLDECDEYSSCFSCSDSPDSDYLVASTKFDINHHLRKRSSGTNKNKLKKHDDAW